MLGLSLDKDLCIYTYRERIKSKSIVSWVFFSPSFIQTHAETYWCVNILNKDHVMSKPFFYLSPVAVMRIKEIISEDLLRASAASGGQQVPIMPPLTLYPQPPRPVIPAAVPRMPSVTPVPGQGHRPAAPHIGVSSGSRKDRSERCLVWMCTRHTTFDNWRKSVSTFWVLFLIIPKSQFHQKNTGHKDNERPSIFTWPWPLKWISRVKIQGL